MRSFLKLEDSARRGRAMCADSVMSHSEFSSSVFQTVDETLSHCVTHTQRNLPKSGRSL